ncbi:MAG TPA: hypothetical protein VMW95_04225 [Desulfobacterales bacterium]|nr:hypothetical protein [Desulfobacterales bacterium]
MQELPHHGATKSKPPEIIEDTTPEIIKDRHPQGGGKREGAGRKPLPDKAKKESNPATSFIDRLEQNTDHLARV